MRWTKLDLVLVILPLLVGFVITAERFSVGFKLSRSAGEVVENIERVASAVNNYKKNTGLWFPPIDPEAPRNDSSVIYLNPFDKEFEVFQGLRQEWFYVENNAGLILQLARFQTSTTPIVSKHTFDKPFQEDDPYLRLLIGYGDRMPEESMVLDLVRERLPGGSFARVDDHLYLIDLRKVMDE